MTTDNPMPNTTHENPNLPSAPPAGSEMDTYCIEYAGNRPDIRGRTYQEASSETEVRHDWVTGEHGLRIVKVTKIPNVERSHGAENH